MARPYKFWDRLATKYSTIPVADEASYRRKLESTRNLLSPTAEVLEIGCGTGTTSLHHAPYAHHIRATDFSEKMLEIARQKAAEAGVENVTFERASVADLSVPDNSLDMVMAHSILHLLPDWEAVLEKVYRMLKPGAVFVSSTTCLGDNLGFLRYVAPITAYLGVLPIVTFFGRRDLSRALRKTGFTIEEEWQPGKGKAVFIVARKGMHEGT